MGGLSDNEILGSLIEVDNLYRLIVRLRDKDGDEQSSDLLYQVATYFSKKFDLNPRELEAFKRMQTVVSRPTDDASNIRNQVFKAAHALGMKLPSMSFAASTLEQEWGSVLKTAEVDARQATALTKKWLIEAGISFSSIKSSTTDFGGFGYGKKVFVRVELNEPLLADMFDNAAKIAKQGGFIIQFKVPGMVFLVSTADAKKH